VPASAYSYFKLTPGAEIRSRPGYYGQFIIALRRLLPEYLPGLSRSLTLRPTRPYFSPSLIQVAEAPLPRSPLKVLTV
jgi:hypothetical protein